ncbi:MAG: diguanylate cyclase [Burkholderiaceae bacterium]
MDLIAPVLDQCARRALPLAAVSMTALPRADTPFLLLLFWHGFDRGSSARLASLGLTPRAVPGTALQINQRWSEIGVIERALLDLAWRLGAWNVERTEQRGCNTIGAPEREALECRQAFGDYAPERSGDPEWIEAPDRREMLDLGARIGFVRWLFRPVHRGLWASVADDATLVDDGGRPGACPLGPEPLRRPWRRSRHVYRLGRGRGLWLPSR